jgi:hypothetical protein
MEWNVRFADDEPLVTIEAKGMAEIEGFRSYLDGVLASPSWRPGVPVLVDFRQLVSDNLTRDDVERLVALHVPYLGRIGGSPIAVVVSRPSDFGVVRVWEAHAAEMFPVHEVFYDVDVALIWLRSRRHNASPSRPV